jgi:murein L,D-transpeptidase YcbB/YkuD
MASWLRRELFKRCRGLLGLGVVLALVSALPAAAYADPPDADKPAKSIDEQVRSTVAARLKKSAYPKVIKSLYALSGGKTLFVDGLKPNARAAQFLKHLAVLPAHGMDRGDFRLGYAYDILRQVKKKRRRAKKKKKGAVASVTTPITLGPAASVADAALLELRLTSALVQYVFHFRFYKMSHPWRSAKTSAKYRKRHHKKIAAFVHGLLPDLPKNLSALFPKQPQYAALMGALKRFRKRATSGEALPKLSWKKWKKATRKHKPPTAELVMTLQKRLKVLGFYKEAVHGRMDQQTRFAVADFRVAHGMTEDGGVTKPAVKSLNVGLVRRVRQIQLALQRWRDSMPGRKGLTHYVHINIPEYKMRLFEKGVMTREHRVVVGTSAYRNRTPFLNTVMYQIIVNPWWYPPERIRVAQFDGRENVVVYPGPRNPLGKVKFMLYRTDAVYMHDTNQKSLFKRGYRAYSHGCVRVQNALDFGRYLTLGWSDVSQEKYDKMLKTGKRHRIKMTAKLDVHADYITAQVLKDGSVRFFSDIYGYDTRFFKTRRWDTVRLVPLPTHAKADFQN